MVVPAENVKRIFQLYAYENVTLDGLVGRLHTEGRVFQTSQPRFPRSMARNILKDRAYICEILHEGVRVRCCWVGNLPAARANPAGDIIQCGH